MKTEIRHKPAFATLHAQIESGETIIGESDAMASMTANTSIRARWNGGFLMALLLKFLGVNRSSIGLPPGWTTRRRGSHLGNPRRHGGDSTRKHRVVHSAGLFRCVYVHIDSRVGWAGFASWIGGEGLFRLKVSGTGTVWIGAYGSIFEKQVQDEYVVDTSPGGVRAHHSNTRWLRRGIFSSFFSGEGLVSRVSGPGKVYLQSRSMAGLASWTNSHLF